MTVTRFDVTPAAEQDYPAEWAEYRRQVDARVPVVTGAPGTCDACGRFLKKDIWDNTGYGPMLFGGLLSFDPGCISITYRCTNDDCSPDVLW
ncbi:hypothetical protein [Arthrobacter caoxuetaonis]|uniref:Uncharacterized protein n=1 Tax=Arthrobacter caoxuetaonis TaxID=2886935 RepID=A0A9X1MIY5_9MICC|nr:hypothetical protein [Arthrobacter caoxuetaonis]MCC3299404.1 hypothetical protein [Arthrobacter caoxuetaonis]USQ59103.1 hypothetical protein NF551_18530 [Arthrobacter caoxuetaonis]